jgi:predicted O-methyltransferase YrrM
MGVHIMNLKSALTRIGHAFALDPLELDMAAHEDPHGGYHSAYDDGFPVGSMWRVEGQFLYALIRALKPKRVLELGTSHGCSATHILQALQDNKQGMLSCVDNGSQIGVVGDMIPAHLFNYTAIEQTPIETYIPYLLKTGWTYDFILEDAMHTVEQVELVWRAADRLLNPGGMIISHDAVHVLVGADVQKGIARAGYADRALMVLIEPADCGFAVWRKAL